MKKTTKTTAAPSSTSSTPTTQETASRLEAARAALEAARAAQQAAQTSAGNDERSSRAALEVAESKERVARAELELDEATMAHRDALLAAEVEAGDEDARQVAGVVANVAERVDDVAALRVRLAEAEAALRGVVADARAAWARVAHRRQAAGEPTPREPSANLAAAVSVARAHAATGAPVDHRQIDAVARALCGGFGSVPAEHIPGATYAEKLEGLFEGRHLDEGNRRSRRAQISRWELDASDLREAIFEAEKRAQQEAEAQAEAAQARKEAREAEAQREAAENAKAVEAEQKRRDARKAELDAHFGA